MFIDRKKQTDLGKVLYGSISNAEFDESKHPRAEDGKFARHILKKNNQVHAGLYKL